jgi:hypothetical protein
VTLARRLLAVLLALCAALMLWVTLTVPAFAATAPALLTIALAFVTWFVYPRKKGAA